MVTRRSSDSDNSASEDDGDVVEHMPNEAKFVLQALKSIELRQAALENQYEQERLQLEKKYDRLHDPLYERRKMLLTGKNSPTDAEVVEGEKILRKEIADYLAPPRGALKHSKLKGIPGFWLTVLKNASDTASMVSDRDEDVLKCLTDIRASHLTPFGSPDPGFRISFSFSPNAFFSNTVLHKEYIYKRGTEPGEDWVFHGSSASTINWSKGRHLVKSAGEDETSFFAFFYPPQRPKEGEREKLNEDDLEALEEAIDQDLVIGEAFKDEIIPDALNLFIYGPEEDEDEDEEGDEVEASEDDESDEDDEDDESD